MSTQGPSQSQGGSLPPKPNPTASPPVNINQDLYSGRNPQTPQVKPAPASSTVSPMPPQPGSKEYGYFLLRIRQYLRGRRFCDDQLE